MGARCSKAQGDARFAAPTGLYPGLAVDARKLRRAIVDRRLAPCFPGATAESDEARGPRPLACTLLARAGALRESFPMCSANSLRLASKEVVWIP